MNQSAGLHGVYVHIPFCAKRCDYCAFATFTDRHHLQGEYVQALRKHIRRPQTGQSDTTSTVCPTTSETVNEHIQGGQSPLAKGQLGLLYRHRLARSNRLDTRACAAKCFERAFRTRCAHGLAQPPPWPNASCYARGRTDLHARTKATGVKSRRHSMDSTGYRTLARSHANNPHDPYCHARDAKWKCRHVARACH